MLASQAEEAGSIPVSCLLKRCKKRIRHTDDVLARSDGCLILFLYRATARTRFALGKSCMHRLSNQIYPIPFYTARQRGQDLPKANLQGVDKFSNLYQHRFLPKLYKSYYSAFPGAGDCSKKLPAVKGCPSTSAQRTAP